MSTETQELDVFDEDGIVCGSLRGTLLAWRLRSYAKNARSSALPNAEFASICCRVRTPIFKIH